MQPTKNSSSLFGDNYGNFHSVHQPEMVLITGISLYLLLLHILEAH